VNNNEPGNDISRERERMEVRREVLDRRQRTTAGDTSMSPHSLELALRESEETYRSLFTTMSQGFCIIEKVDTPAGRPSDFRYITANPAFERHTGMHDVVGKTIRELIPDAEDRIIDIYDEVVRTGAHRYFVDYVSALDLWMEAEAFPVQRPKQIAVLFANVSARKRAEETAERERAELERAMLRRRLAATEEDERRRLSRELHDEVGQHLTALGLGLQALSDVATPGSEVDRRATQLRSLADLLGRELHDLAVRLRPRALDDFGLEAALAAYGEEWAAHSGVTIDVHTGAEAERLPAAVESAVYRVVQEALTNVAKHSGATHASVVVERRDGHVIAIIEDDGRGFDTSIGMDSAASSGSGLGLLGISERAALLGGTLEIESAPGGGGTTLYFRIPISAPTGVATAAYANASNEGAAGTRGGSGANSRSGADDDV
jgi:signal transduction histidine kinase